MYVKAGSYTGDGTDNRDISIGFEPLWVFIISVGSRHVERFADHGDDQAWVDASASGAQTNQIQGFNSDGFQVGTAANVNTNSTTYFYLAVGDSGDNDVNVVKYIGNGADNRDITGVGFQPNLILLLGTTSTASPSILRTSTMAGDLSSPYSGGGSSGANLIQSILSDGFQVGSDGGVNGNGDFYHAVCFKSATDLFAVGTYTGNGSDDRNITGVGFDPSIVWIKRTDDKEGLLGQWAEQAADSCWEFFAGGTGSLGSDLIQDIISDGFQVGTDPAVNESSGTYHWMAWADNVPNPSVALTGTATASIDEDDIVAGGKTVIATLTDGKYQPASVSAMPLVSDSDILEDTTAGTTTQGGPVVSYEKGDRVILIVACDGSDVTITPAALAGGGSFSAIVDSDSDAQSDAHTMAMFYADATGESRLDTLNYNLSASEESSAVAYVLRKGTFDPSTAPEAAVTGTTGNTSSPNPPSLTPSWDGSDVPTLWGVAISWDADTSATTWSWTGGASAFPDGRLVTSPASDGSAGLATAYAATDPNVDTLDPAVFTSAMSSSEEYAAVTWAVKGILETPFADARQDFIDGFDSAQSETTGWDNEVKANQGVSGVVRTSDTVVTLTLDAQAAYDITAQETITGTIPASILRGGGPVVASPTFTIDAVGGSQEESGSGAIAAEAEVSATGEKNSSDSVALEADADAQATGTGAHTGAQDINTEADVAATGTGAHAGTSDVDTSADVAASGTSARPGVGQAEAEAETEGSGTSARAGVGAIEVEAEAQATGSHASTDSAALEVEAAVSANGQPGFSGQASEEAEAEVSATGTGGHSSSGALGVNSGASGSGTGSHTGGASLEAVATPEAFGESARAGDTAVALTVAVQASGFKSSTDSVALEVEAAIDYTSTSARSGSAQVEAEAAAEASGSALPGGSASIEATAEVLAEGQSAHSGAGSSLAESSVSAQGTSARESAAEISVAVSVIASGFKGAGSSATVSLEASAQASGQANKQGQGQIEVECSAESSGSPARANAASVVVTVALSTTGTSTRSGQASIEAEAAINYTATVDAFVSKIRGLKGRHETELALQGLQESEQELTGRSSSDISITGRRS